VHCAGKLKRIRFYYCNFAFLVVHHMKENYKKNKRERGWVVVYFECNRKIIEKCS